MPRSWFSETKDYSLFEAGDKEKEKKRENEDIKTVTEGKNKQA